MDATEFICFNYLKNLIKVVIRLKTNGTVSKTIYPLFIPVFFLYYRNNSELIEHYLRLFEEIITLRLIFLYKNMFIQKSNSHNYITGLQKNAITIFTFNDKSQVLWDLI